MTATSRRKVLSNVAVGAGTWMLQRKALSQAGGGSGTWPSRPVRLVVAFPPGGLTDAWARLYAEQFQAATGQPCVVENKPGAGGNIAIDLVVKAPADGYTFLITTSGAVWQNRVLYSSLPFDLAKDIQPVCLYPSGPLVMGVGDKVPARNYGEFLEFARRTPCTMGSYAPASHPHMLADYMARHEGAKINTVNYKGEAPMWVDLVGGQIQIAVGSFQAFNTVAAKGVRPIAVTGTYRSPRLPDVPTLPEQRGGGEIGGLVGGLPITARTEVAPDIVQRAARIAVEGWDQPKARSIRENFAIPDPVLGLEETRKVWRELAPIWIRQAQSLGVKLD
jgi:tripartite-type tricarboxylate transporter receptor subunit TctC